MMRLILLLLLITISYGIEQISFSGRLAKYFTHLHLTQWQHLANQKTLFLGKVL